MLGKHEKKGRLEHTCCCEGKEHGLPLRPAPVCAPGRGRAPLPAPAVGRGAHAPARPRASCRKLAGLLQDAARSRPCLLPTPAGSPGSQGQALPSSATLTVVCSAGRRCPRTATRAEPGALGV